MKLLSLLEDVNTQLYDKLFSGYNGGVSYVVRDKQIDKYRELSISFHRYNGVNHKLSKEDGYHKFKLRIIIRDDNKDDFGDDHENSIRLYSNDLSKLYMLLKPITIIMRKNKDINSTAKQLNNIPKRKVKMMMVNKFEDKDTFW